MRAAIIFVIALVATAHADDRAKAEQFFRAGENAFRKQNYAAAAYNFEKAYQAAPIPEIAFSAAQSYRRQFFIETTPKPEIAKRAIDLYRVYLEKVTSEGRRGDASDGIAEMKRELDKLAPTTTPEPPPKPATRLAISVVVAGEESRRALGDLSPMPSGDVLKAKTTLDGKSVELFNPIEVKSGEHTAEVIADGYFPAKQSKTVIEGYDDIIEIVLQPKPARLAVRTNARVVIDGIHGEHARELAAGRHVVTVSKRGHVPQVREVVLRRGEERTLDVDLAKTDRRRRVPWVLIGAGGLGVLGLTSTFVALYYDNEMGDIDSERTASGINEARYDDYKRATNRRDTFRTSAFVLGGAAVVTAGVALGMYLFDEPSTEGIRLVPDPSGVSVVGRF